MMRLSRLRNDQGGVTLVELLVVLVILGVVGAASVQVVMTMVRAEVVSTDLRDRMDRGRLALQRIREDTRFASEICPASDDRTLEVYSELPDGSTERMRYEFVTTADGTTLEFENLLTGATGTLADDFAPASAFAYVGTLPPDQPSTLDCPFPTPPDPVNDANPLTDGVQVRLVLAASGEDVVEERVLDTEIEIRNANLDRTVVNFNPQPVARYTYSCTELVCEFDAGNSSDDGEILSYTWDFGDGSPLEIVTGAGISHEFPAEGRYDVTLTVEDDFGGTGSTLDQVDTTVVGDGASGPQAPTATFTHECSGLTCTFDGRTSIDSDGTVVSWTWTFGDGTEISGVGSSPVTRTYAAPGTYTATLVVTDNGGLDSATATTEVVVVGGGRRIYVDDVTGTGSNPNEWTATATWTVGSTPEGSVAGALVRARWKDTGGTVTCTIPAGASSCTIVRSPINKQSTPTVTLEIVEIVLSGTAYDASENSDQSIQLCRGGC